MCAGIIQGAFLYNNLSTACVRACVRACVHACGLKILCYKAIVYL